MRADEPGWDALVVAAAVGLVLACRAAPQTHEIAALPTFERNEPSAPMPTPAPVPTLTLEQRLDAHAVTVDDYVRLELYSWTTPAQIEALRAGGPLLVADASTDGFASPFHQLLAEMIAERRPGHEFAALLNATPGLAKRRYAWPSPFATVLGKGTRGYGEALIFVRLRPEAVMARLDPSADPPWRFQDGTGHEVAPEEILADPQRLGVVFHARVATNDGISFREYVLCNEAMVAQWSVGTAAILERVESERRLMLELLTVSFSVPPLAVARWRAWPQWIDHQPAPTLLSRWHRTLAFDNNGYRPTPEHLEAIAAALADYDPTGPALTGPAPVGGSALQAPR